MKWIWLSLMVCLLAGDGVNRRAAAQGPEGWRREANTTLNLPPVAPAYNFTTERAFGALTFMDPVAVASPPGETNRLFVVEQRGRISVITNLASPTRTLFLDIAPFTAGGTPADERGLLGLAFHPGYATNRYFFVFYTGLTATSAGNGLHNIISRFETSAEDPNRVREGSEVMFLAQFDQAGNHNGGDIHFGPDGYLYIAAGDEGGGNDQYNNSQLIDKDFFAGILRIDVDKRPGNLPPNPHPASTSHYLVPADNPFVGAAEFNGRAVNPQSVRTEFYAVGLRNPWRMSFDPATGFLYCGDVGQGAREEINIIVKGGNYGWAFREGSIGGPKAGQAPAGFSGIRPIHEYPQVGPSTNSGRSVTGGVVYRGARLGGLFGAYVFADYLSGNVWALRYDGTNTAAFRWLLTERAIAGFGIDPSNQDILIADQDQDTIKRLAPATSSVGTAFPETLAETGAFSDLGRLEPQPGIVPYEINAPFWSDHAVKRRWFSVPQTNQFLTFHPDHNWVAPTGTVWIKHFDLTLTNGVPESARRVETRFLMRTAEGLYGLTYRWDDTQTNAALVPEGGMDEVFVINDNGTPRSQTWHYPGRNECLMCHTAAAGWALGFNTAQLNRPSAAHPAGENQIRLLRDAGYFAASDNIHASGIHALPGLAPAEDESQSLEFRVRSYLAANCANCHQPGGGALGRLDLRWNVPTSETGLIDGLLNNDGGDPARRVIAPGSLERSSLYNRVANFGPGHMPPLSTSVLDRKAIDLLRAWIVEDLPRRKDFGQWRTDLFGSPDAAGAGRFEDPDGDGAANYLEYLTETDPLNAGSVWRIGVRHAANGVEITFPRTANRLFQVQAAADLFDPDAWRPLDAPSNRFYYSPTNTISSVLDPNTDAPFRFYRVEVREP